ncbi:MAG: DUF1648 domain-containing protein [Ekhidna sp.]|nr:DUF1648 domain-containing protein [Ekhidna sp.]
MKTKQITKVICITLLSLQSFFIVSSYNKLPDRIAIHLNMKGEIDNYGSKAMLFILLGISIMLCFSFYYARKKPMKFNDNSSNEKERDRISRKSQNLMDYLNINTQLVMTFLAAVFTVLYEKYTSSLIFIFYFLILLPMVILFFYIKGIVKVK